MSRGLAIANDTLYGLGLVFGHVTQIFATGWAVEFKLVGFGSIVITPIQPMQLLAVTRILALAEKRTK